MKNILLVYCQHGNEIATEKTAEYFQRKFGIDILLGNPQAREKNVRLIESDLNRSFNRADTLEGKRALDIKSKLNDHNYDLIIDMHTTKAKMPSLGIITNLAQLQYVKYSGLENVVLMSEEFSTGGSLIENISKSFSIEVYDDESAFDELSCIINNIIDGQRANTTFNIYEVIEIVKGSNSGDIKNLKGLQDSTYPIFAGENTYKGISYLKAKKYRYKLKD